MTLPVMGVGIAFAPQRPLALSSALLLMRLTPWSAIPSAVRSNPAMAGLSFPWQAEMPEHVRHLATVVAPGQVLVKMASAESVDVPVHASAAPVAPTCTAR